MKKSGKKVCSLGASCKGACISRSKNCLTNLAPSQKAKVSKAAEKLQASILSVKVNKFTGSIAEATKLLEDFNSRTSKLSAAIITSKAKVAKELLEHAADFNQLTGKELTKLKEIKLSPERSYANVKEGIIVIDSRKNPLSFRAAVFHEMGHFLERSDPKYMSKATEFVKSNATGPKEQLSKLTGDSRYAPTEYAYPGKFLNPYVGKLYLSGATEVVSVGLEHFSSPLNLAKLYKADPVHFKVIAEILE
jgi:hypothetical protein